MWLTWREAMQQALYGPGGFYARGELPAAHFRTSAHVLPRYADAVLSLLRETDMALGQPDRLDLVDLGAGRGELLAQVLALAGQDPALAGRLRAQAVEVAPRPPGLAPQIRWCRSVPPGITGLVIANEWLDNVPVDAAELRPDGPRLLLVDPASGDERAGPPPGAADRAWLERWWPLRVCGDRAEIGLTRDRAWAAVVGKLARGLAVAADYGHRRAARPPAGTLAGYRDGRLVRPVPDGSCDVTAHLAVDACAAAGEAGAGPALVASQCSVLSALGLRGARPPLRLAEQDPGRYLAALAQATADAELTDPGGLGGFSWLIQPVGVPLPATLASLGAAPSRMRSGSVRGSLPQTATNRM